MTPTSAHLLHESTSLDSIGVPELQCLRPIDLSAAMKVDLLNRIDTKVMLDLPRLRQVTAHLVQNAGSNYHLVVTPTGPHPAYSSLYFDTPDLRHYTDHHNGRRIRHKIRYRHYKSTDSFFFEVKQRTGPRRTAKTRIEVEGLPWKLGRSERTLIDHMGIDGTGIEPMLHVVYERITLLGVGERVTIDLGLNCEGRNSRRVDFGSAAILEVKRERSSTDSPMLGALRALGIRQGSVSKYCVGVASCFNVKRNRFEANLRELERCS